MRKMPPGSFVAMGTNGLTDIEVRCIAHALKLANVAGAAALRFQEMVSAKLATLPDLDDDALPAVAQQPGASPGRMAAWARQGWIGTPPEGPRP